MIEKILNCIYCHKPMESLTAKKKFCSEKCRVYYHRELARGTLGIPIVEITKKVKNYYAETIENNFPEPNSKSVKKSISDKLDEPEKKLTIADMPNGLSFFQKRQWKEINGIK